MTVFRDNPGLLEPFRRGARPAMEVVYWRYVRRIETLVRHGFSVPGRAPVRASAAEVEDLVQEIFARAFAERGRLAFDGVRAYEPFLATLARNVVIDWGRRQGREVSLETTSELPEPVAPPEVAEAAWEDAAVGAIVQRYLAQLPAELAAVHRQRYIVGQTQEQAAAALGISRQQLRTREQQLREGLDRALLAAGKK